MKKYSPKWYIAKFESIPDEEWATEKYVEEDGTMCALGHCGARADDENGLDEILPIEAKKLVNIFGEIKGLVPNINDAQKWVYSPYHDLGDTPKERMINALVLVDCGLWDIAHET